MTAEELYHDPLFAQFYDADCPWSDDREYCLQLAEGCRSVLDLGCGTGSLALAIARKHDCDVVGVDPAGAMLDVARRQDGAGKVSWVEADARDVMLGRQFDLIVMTGHAFQCLLTEQDQLALMSTMRKHLAPDGRFIFDSRNPLREEWREWVPAVSEHRFSHPMLGEIRGWHDVAFDFDTSIATYETYYEIVSTGRTHHAPTSRIAFPRKEALAALLDRSGLGVDRWLGDWDGSVWRETAPEIIALGMLRPSP